MNYRVLLFLERWPFDLSLVGARCAAAYYVWRWVQRSGNGYETDEFHRAARWLADYGFTLDRAAELITWVGIGLTLSLVTGFGTRITAAALFFLFLWSDYFAHTHNITLNFALMALLPVLFTRGAGRIAIDYMLIRR